MSGFPRVREDCARSAQERPVCSIWSLPRIFPSRRRVVLPIATLAAALLATVSFGTFADVTSCGVLVGLTPSYIAEASPLADDPAGQEGLFAEVVVEDESAPLEEGGIPTEDESVPTEDGTVEEEGAEGLYDGRSGSRVTTSSRGGLRPSISVGQQVAAAAMEQLGARYRWGGTSPAGFDCSGFTLYAYRQLGIELPRHLWGQLNSGRRVGFDELKPGDLVFFENTYSWGLTHSGLYIGDDQFIHAESEWTGVVVSPLRGSNWEINFAGASRPYEQ